MTAAVCKTTMTFAVGILRLISAPMQGVAGVVFVGSTSARYPSHSTADHATKGACSIVSFSSMGRFIAH